MIRVECSPLIRKPVSKIVNLPTIARVYGFDDEDVRRFGEDAQAAIETGQDFFPIVISSDGGSVIGLLQMLDIIDRVKGYMGVVTIIEGRAYSAAAVLATAGDSALRFVSPLATAMIHQASSSARGKTTDVMSDARELARVNAKMLRLMSKNCGHEAGYFEALLKDNGNSDLYLDAKACVKHGISNHIEAPIIKVRVDVSIALEHAPKRSVEKRRGPSDKRTR